MRWTLLSALVVVLGAAYFVLRRAELARMKRSMSVALGNTKRACRWAACPGVRLEECSTCIRPLRSTTE